MSGLRAFHPREAAQVVRDVAREMRHDNVAIIAAGVAFYSVLAMLPALVIAVSVYGLFTNTTEAERQIDALLEVIPESTVRVLEAQMRTVSDLSEAGLSLGVLVSLLALVWTVSSAVRAMIRAVVIAYDQDELRSSLERRHVALGLTVVFLSAGLVALALIAAVPVWLRRFDPTDAIVTFGNFRWLLIGVSMVGGTALLYRFAPPRRPESWRAVAPGAVAATLLWTLVSIGFSIYVSSFGRYNQTYGVLGAAIVLLLWFWLTAVAVILGAELNEVLTIRARGPTPREPVPPRPTS
jgi:membrane protein